MSAKAKDSGVGLDLGTASTLEPEFARRILTPHPSPGQTQASLSSTTQPSTQLLGRLCVALGLQTWAQTHLPFSTCSLS